jgi:hypothetical protein
MQEGLPCRLPERTELTVKRNIAFLSVISNVKNIIFLCKIALFKWVKKALFLLWENR